MFDEQYFENIRREIQSMVSRATEPFDQRRLQHNRGRKIRRGISTDSVLFERIDRDQCSWSGNGNVWKTRLGFFELNEDKETKNK